MYNIMRQVCERYDLGNIVTEPIWVTGGLLHKMYHVITDKGEYAIKALNPDIMQKPEALQNTVNSERISHALQDIIPLVTARELAGEYVVKYDNHYFMIFDWLEGESVFCPNITVSHCRAVGDILGKMHSANITIEGMERQQEERKLFDWEQYLQEAEVQKVSWLSEYSVMLPKLKSWDEQIQVYAQELSKYQVISHRDLDPKNIMWQQERPFVIDWEAAGYVSPWQELIEVLNYWIVDEHGAYVKEKFDALMQAYCAHVDIDAVNWEAVLSSGYDGMLGWLEYNLKRALGLEGSKQSDRQEGEEQVRGTLAELRKYEMRVGLLREWLNKERVK